MDSMRRVRRKKTAAQRRQQRERAQGRLLQSLLRNLSALDHRGSKLSACGAALKSALSSEKAAANASASKTTTSPRPDVVTAKPAACKHYAIGHCRFGNMCRFSHDLPAADILPSSVLRANAPEFVLHPKSSKTEDGTTHEANEVVFSPGVFVPDEFGILRQLSSSAMPDSMSVDISYWERLLQSFKRVGFDEEFQRLLLSGQLPDNDAIGIASDVMSVSFGLDGLCKTISACASVPFRDAFHSACEALNVDPSVYEVVDANSCLVRLHKSAAALGLRSGDAFSLARITVDIDDREDDLPSPPPRRIIRNSNVAASDDQYMMREGTPVPLRTGTSIDTEDTEETIGELLGSDIDD